MSSKLVGKALQCNCVKPLEFFQKASEAEFKISGVFIR